MRILYYLLVTVGLASSVHFQLQLPYLQASLLAGLINGLVLLFISWLILRKHKGAVLGFIWGIACTGPAVFFGTQLDEIQAKFHVQWLDAAGFAPLNEETLKFIGVLLICTYFIKPERARDYVFVGIAVGMGFAIVEDFAFIARITLYDLDSDTVGAAAGVSIRTFGNPFGHALYTGLAAFGLSRKNPFLWWLLGVALHTLNNLFPSLASTFPDANWPIIASFCVVAGTWTTCIWLFARMVRSARRERKLSQSDVSDAPVHSPLVPAKN